MTESFIIAIKAVIAWFILFALVSLVFAFIYPSVHSLIKKASTKKRLMLNFGFAISQFLVPTSVLLLYSFPEFSQHFVGFHCHGSECGPHSLHLPVDSKLGSGVLITMAIVICAIVSLLLTQFVKTRKYLRLMQQLADDSHHSDYKVFNTDKLLAWCAGLIKTQVFISEGLVAKLNPKQLNFVLAHEYAHALGHDNIKKLLVKWLLILWPQKNAKLLTRLIELDLEVICDRRAAQGRFSKAELVEVFDLISKEVTPSRDAKHNCLSHIEYRMRHFSEMHSQSSYLAWFCLFFVAFVLLFVLAQFAHPALEWLLR